MSRLGALAWRFSGAFPQFIPEPGAECKGSWRCVEAPGRRRVLEEGAFQGQSGLHLLPEQEAVIPVFQGFSEPSP